MKTSTLLFIIAGILTVGILNVMIWLEPNKVSTTIVVNSAVVVLVCYFRAFNYKSKGK